MSEPGEGVREPIDENIGAVLEYYAQEEQRRSGSQRTLEGMSHFIGRPLFLGIIVLFVALWIGLNKSLGSLSLSVFDPAPFFWLQGIIGLSALLTATIVLSKQNRLARLAEQRDHLGIKVTLLTEQKVAKLIDLLEELRRDLPNVTDRHDSDAVALRQSMSRGEVLATLDEGRQSGLAPGMEVRR
jgi:uncharacterized membrane protein